MNEDEVVMVVNLSATDRLSKAQEIIESEGLTQVSYYDIDDEMKHFGVVGVPTAFYIDDQGIIKNITYGADNAEGILNKIRE